MAGIVHLRVLNRNAAQISAASFVERNCVLGRIRHNPRREVRLDKCRQQFGFGVSAQLEQRFYDRRNKGNAAVLVRPFRFHDVQHLGQSGLFANDLHTLPYGFLAVEPLVRIGISDVVRHNGTAAVHLYTVENLVPVVGVLAYSVSQNVNRAAVSVRCRHPVGLHQMQPQGVGVQLINVPDFHNGENIAAHKPAFQGQLLQSVEVVHPHSIAVAAVLGPEPELGLSLGLPFLGRLRGKTQNVPVDGGFQGQASADHLCAVRVDGTCGDRCAHVEHPAALPQGVGVVVYIAGWRIAVREKCPQRTPLMACTSLAVSAGLRRSRCTVFQNIASITFKLSGLAGERSEKQPARGKDPDGPLPKIVTSLAE